MTVVTGFGNGAPWESFLHPPMTLEQIEALAAWFLVLRPAAPEPTGAPTAASGLLDFEDPTTGGINRTIKRSPTGSFLGVGSGNTQLIFRVVRASRSTFDFISVGRNEGNDVCLPDQSVSRFHAYLRETPAGELFVQDARSNNGTVVNGAAVPRQGEGPAVRVTSGDAIRFGDVHGEVVAAAELLKRLRAAPQAAS